jgi:hypothetical protein
MWTSAQPNGPVGLKLRVRSFIMKRIGFIATTLLLAGLLAAPVLGDEAQDKDRDKQKGRRSGQQQQKQRQAPQRTERDQQRRSVSQQRDQQVQQRNTWQQRRARSFQTESRTWGQRGGYNGYHIPDSYFSSYYGRDHGFRLFGLPFRIVSGNPRFQYGGYWFTSMDPYPEYWGDSWYETDDVYVDYADDGYYLYNRTHPGRAGIAISISF